MRRLFQHMKLVAWNSPPAVAGSDGRVIRTNRRMASNAGCWQPSDSASVQEPPAGSQARRPADSLRAQAPVQLLDFQLALTRLTTDLKESLHLALSAFSAN